MKLKVIVHFTNLNELEDCFINLEGLPTIFLIGESPHEISTSNL